MEAVAQLPVSQAEQLRESARKAAIFSGGHRFIWLTLLEHRFHRISGVELIHSTPYIDEMAGNITRYHLEKRSGSTDFQFDASKGAFRYAMLDSDYNRKFLASHFHLKIWYIEDDKIRNEIEAMSKAIEKNIKGKKENPEKDDTPTEEATNEVPKKRPYRRKTSVVKSDPPTTGAVLPQYPEMPLLPGVHSDMVTTRVNQP